jgi:hypothetical protein
MRVLIGFLIVPGLSLAVGLLIGALLQWQLSWREASVLITIAYISALVLGFPCFLLLRALHRHSWYHFLVAGAIVGLVAYWVVSEMMPVLGAYREGRYSQDQALSALRILDQPLIGIYAAGIGALASLMLWLILYPPPGARVQSLH